MPRLRHAWCVVLESNPLASERDLHRALRELWDGAEYRGDARPRWRCSTAGRSGSTFVVEGAWCEHVDTLARRVGNLAAAGRLASPARYGGGVGTRTRGSAGFRRLPARSQGRDRPHAPLRLCRAEPRRSRVLRPGRRSAGRFATMRGRPRRGRPPRARAPASARSRAARRPGPRAAPRRPKPLDRARRYEGGGASGSAGGSTTLLNLTVPSVRKIAVKPTITFTTVSVSFIPTLKARSVERATPTSRNA
jgi:hypothetical protein